MTLSEITKLIAVLKAVYTNHPVSGDTAGAYHFLLADLPYEAVMSAAKEWMLTNQFFPKPNELTQILADRVAGVDPWETGFDEVMVCVKEHGSYIGSRFGNDGGNWSSPILSQAVRHIGYEAFCLAELDNMGTLRAQFRDAYERERKRQTKALQVGGLGVLAEANAVAVAAGGVSDE